MYAGSVSNAGEVGIVNDESEKDAGLLPAMLSYEPPGAEPRLPKGAFELLVEDGDGWKALFACGGAPRVAVCGGGCEGGC